MIDSIYRLIGGFGYTHPLHPPTTHLPIGLVIGAFVLGLTAFLFKKPLLAQSARHVFILALIFFFPTVLLGFMDWQHFYAGAFVFPIQMKIRLSIVLGILLGIGVLLFRETEKSAHRSLPIFGLCFLVVLTIGYFGGDLVFGEKTASLNQEDSSLKQEDYTAGKDIFAANCIGCHPNGGNVILPEFPIRGSSRLNDLGAFMFFFRNPTLPDGQKGPMPSFSETTVSDSQAKDLYLFLTRVLVKQ